MEQTTVNIGIVAVSRVTCVTTNLNQRICSHCAKKWRIKAQMTRIFTTNTNIGTRHIDTIEMRFVFQLFTYHVNQPDIDNDNSISTNLKRFVSLRFRCFLFKERKLMAQIYRSQMFNMKFPFLPAECHTRVSFSTCCLWMATRHALHHFFRLIHHPIWSKYANFLACVFIHRLGKFERSNKNRSSRLIYTNIDGLFFAICRTVCRCQKRPKCRSYAHVSLSSFDVLVYPIHVWADWLRLGKYLCTPPDLFQNLKPYPGCTTTRTWLRYSC